MNGESNTPRTDAEIDDATNFALDFECRNLPPKEGENILVVSADFARTLERELREACHNCKECMDLVEENVQLRSDLRMLLAELDGVYTGLMMHPSDVPLNGCLISEASKEKLGVIKELIKRYENRR